MKIRTILTLALLTPALQARAAETTLGVGGAFAHDLADGFEGASATRYTGGGLLVPVRFEVSPAAALRVDVRAEAGSGHSQVSWRPDGVDQVTEVERAFLVAGGATVGPEVVLAPGNAVRPYFGGGIGGAVVANYHDFGERCEVFDPDAGIDCARDMDVQPYSLAPALLTTADVGLRVGSSGFFWTEVGYGAAFLPSVTLRRSHPDRDVVRDGYAWNTLRLAVGYSFPL